jgi:cytochrome c-type biogenesis protein CcmH/NrfF
MTFILWLAPIILLIGGIMLIIITRPKNNPQSMKEHGHDR